MRAPAFRGLRALGDAYSAQGLETARSSGRRLYNPYPGLPQNRTGDR